MSHADSLGCSRDITGCLMRKSNRKWKQYCSLKCAALDEKAETMLVAIETGCCAEQARTARVSYAKVFEANCTKARWCHVTQFMLSTIRLPHVPFLGFLDPTTASSKQLECQHHKFTDSIDVFQWLSLYLVSPAIYFSLCCAVQHEKHETGAPLPRVWWDGEAAHPPALPTQRVSPVCSWGVGTKRLSSSRSPCGTQLTSFHPQHSLPTTGTQAHTQNSWPPGSGPQNRWRSWHTSWHTSILLCIHSFELSSHDLFNCMQRYSGRKVRKRLWSRCVFFLCEHTFTYDFISLLFMYVSLSLLLCSSISVWDVSRTKA